MPDGLAFSKTVGMKKEVHPARTVNFDLETLKYVLLF
jgi:hypothetical protein